MTINQKVNHNREISTLIYSVKPKVKNLHFCSAELCLNLTQQVDNLFIFIEV